MAPSSYSMSSDNQATPEPRVVLFPLTEGSVETVKAPQEAQQPERPAPPVDPIRPSQNKEIAELQLRLRLIKERRAMQHKRSLELKRQQLELQHREQPPSPPEQPLQLQLDVLKPQESTVRAPSLSSQTAEETIDTSFASSLSSWNPKRLMCSTYKVKKSKHSSAAARTRLSRDDPLDRIVCMGRQPDPLDAIVCAGRINKPRVETNYATLEEVEVESSFDPYGGTQETLTQEAVEKRNDAWDLVPRGSSEWDSEDSQALDPTKSCLPSRRQSSSWYVRTANGEAVPNVEAQIMQMVYFTKE